MPNPLSIKFYVYETGREYGKVEVVVTLKSVMSVTEASMIHQE